MSKCFWFGPRIICGNWCFSVFTAWSQPLWTESKKKAIVHKAAQNCHITLCQRTWREAWWKLAANSLVTWHQNKWGWIRWSPACLVWTCPGHHSDCTEPTEAHGGGSVLICWWKRSRCLGGWHLLMMARWIPQHDNNPKHITWVCQEEKKLKRLPGQVSPTPYLIFVQDIIHINYDLICHQK